MCANQADSRVKYLTSIRIDKPLKGAVDVQLVLVVKNVMFKSAQATIVTQPQQE